MRCSAELCGALLPILLLSSASPAIAQVEDPNDTVAAMVNGKTVMSSEVRDRMREILAETGVVPSEEVLLRIRDQALNELVSKRAPPPQTPPAAEEPEAEAAPSEESDPSADPR